jgi:hypothetical protein
MEEKSASAAALEVSTVAAVALALVERLAPVEGLTTVEELVAATGAAGGAASAASELVSGEADAPAEVALELEELLLFPQTADVVVAADNAAVDVAGGVDVADGAAADVVAGAADDDDDEDDDDAAESVS